MNISVVDMTPEEQGRLRGLLDHPDFELLRTAITIKESELQLLAGDAVTESMVYGNAGPTALPVEVQAKAVQALRWRAARQVLDEVAGPKFWPAREIRLKAED